MKQITLALRNIRADWLRSMVIMLCVLGIAAFFVVTTLVAKGAQNSLDRGLQRLGADILVVPVGAEAKVETALLMGKPTQVWMPAEIERSIAGVKGVKAVSSQVYVQSMFDAPCCSVSEMFVVVYDSVTDFTVSPWLQQNLGRQLKKGEVIGGTYIFVPDGDDYIRMYGSNLTLMGNLEPTGTGIDQTMFMTLETAREMASNSLFAAMEVLTVPEGQISTVMVQTDAAVNPHQVALNIQQDVPGVIAIESPNLFGAFRKQMMGLLWGFVALLVMAWTLSVILIGLVFSMAANERRRQIAVLRAIGATRFFVLRSILSEAALLALAGGVGGVLLGSVGVYLLRDYLAGSLRMPFLFPSPASYASLFALGLGLSLLTVVAAVFWPAFSISKQEPALAMRE